MKLAILEPLGIDNASLLSLLREQIGEQVEIVTFDNRDEDPQALIERAQGAQMVVLSNIPFGRDVLQNLPELKMICVAFTGVDHIDIAYCKEHGITVQNCAGYSTVAVADLVFGFALNLARNIQTCNQATRQGLTKQGLIGYELCGKAFGIVGLGAIGQRVANIANAFGCKVYAYSRTPKQVPGVTMVDLPTLLKTCDIVSLHVPLNASTRGMIGKNELAMMKKSAYLINTARGPVVDEEALAEALKAGVIAGAGVDVYEEEPPIPYNHPLIAAPHVIMTPHVGFATEQAFEKRAVIVAQNLKSYLAGKPINQIV